MQQNKPIISMVLVIAVLIGLLVYIRMDTKVSSEIETQNESSQTSREVEGTVIAVDLDAIAADGPAYITIVSSNGTEELIAVPSMGRNLCAAKEMLGDPMMAEVGDIAMVRGSVSPEDGAIVPCENAEHYLRLVGVVSSANQSLEFSYRKSPEGYVITTLPRTASEHPYFQNGYILTLKDDYDEIQSSTDVREGPPSIVVRTYMNPEKLWPSVWIERYPRESNIELAFSSPEEISVGGAKAVSYTTDGLYPIKTYVVTQGEYVYVFMASYLDTTSPQLTDIEDILESVRFIPPKGA